MTHIIAIISRHIVCIYLIDFQLNTDPTSKFCVFTLNADHILIHTAQPEVGYSLISNESHIFLIVNPQFQLQILRSFGDITKSVKLNGIPENNFLCIFIIASTPGVHTFFCLWRVNKKLPQGETSQNTFQRSRSIN